jgi:hypothetical protein
MKKYKIVYKGLVQENNLIFFVIDIGENMELKQIGGER